MKALRQVQLLTLLSCFVMATSLLAQEKKKEDTYVLITNVNVWSGADDKVVKQDVLIKNNLFEEIGTGLKAPENAEVIDGKGGTLTPGLIDMHTHIMLNGPKAFYTGSQDYDAFAIGAWAYKDMNMLLDMGFTSIRDIAGNSLSIAKAVKNKVMRGPRIWSSGPAFSSTGGHGDAGPWNELPGEKNQPHRTMNLATADGIDEIIKHARWNYRHGAAYAKIMASGGVASEFDPLEITEYTFDEMKMIVQISEDNRTYATIHAYHDDAINRAIDAGVKCVEHGFLMSEKTVKRMADENIVLSLQGYVSTVQFAEASQIPWFSPEQVRKATQVYEGAKQMIEWAKKYGVFIVSGSDMFAENTPNAKQNITVEKNFGWKPWEILQHVTYNAGKVLAMSGPARNPYREGPLGVIEKGAYADVIIWEKSPLEDIENVIPNENIKVLIQDGKVLKNMY
ncbi:amidohydrolase family protein [Sediminitomix flava]|uniref:Imidazolonepropionase-like amidohydrolase n=1 Tax=Sediminitomix flava TaxID=379075 RepID=A0A315ZGD7_SEDFL|nr:amidohydrolase family protein [Sediminitomix flava]PWJ44655.1 imidazolonepropionase-like amidohydrolase [Sediminitomix flava]